MKVKLTLCTIILFSACNSAQKQNIPEPIVVKRVEVGVDTIVNRQTFISTLSPNYIAIIQPRVNGFLSAKMFSNGMPVTRGQTIFRIDDREQRANLLAAQASLASATAKEAEAANNYSRAVPLAAIDAISKLQLDQYTAQYKAAKAAVDAAKQQLTNARLEVEYTTIKAPISGVISSAEAYAGDYVGPGTKFATLTRIENIDTLCANIAIPVREYLSWTNRRSFTYKNDDLLSDIELYLADGSLYPFKGKYSYTKTAVADNEGTMIIVITFPNADYMLKSGQFARVKCNIGKPREVFVVPTNAIKQIQGINSVWVIDKDSVARYRQVEIGNQVGNKQIVTAGVSAGEYVSSDGNINLTNGQKVLLYE